MKDFRDLKVWEKPMHWFLSAMKLRSLFRGKRSSDSSLRFSEQQHQFLQTLRKAVAVGEMGNSTGSCRWPWAQQMNLNTICYCPKTWDISNQKIISECNHKSRK
jgi:hypothetical protein